MNKTYTLGNLTNKQINELEQCYNTKLLPVDSSIYVFKGTGTKPYTSTFSRR